MATFSTEDWKNCAEAFAFLGNSLLAPMSKTPPVGLDPEFWTLFPSFDDDNVASAIEACTAYAQDAQAYIAESGNAVQRASVEYTKLFLGPPRPAAAPWETVQLSNGTAVGFGEPTFEMQRLLRDIGLEVSNENNQYADHIGIELMYISVLCEHACSAADSQDNETLERIATQIGEFATKHPLAWIDELIADVKAAEPDGYIIGILRLAKALLALL